MNDINGCLDSLYEAQSALFPYLVGMLLGLYLILFVLEFLLFILGRST